MTGRWWSRLWPPPTAAKFPCAAARRGGAQSFRCSLCGTRQAHLQAYPMTEWDAQKAEMRARLRRLRRQHDELSEEARARGQQLDDLKTTLERRRQQDAFTESCISAGEAMMVELEKRLHRLHHALTGARRLEAFYRKVVLLCNENSPRPDAHVSVIEKRVEASRLSLRDTEQRRRAARYTLRHLKTGELPRMKQELERAHNMHRKVLDKLRSLRDAQRRQVREKQERRDKRRVLSKQVCGPWRGPTSLPPPDSPACGADPRAAVGAAGTAPAHDRGGGGGGGGAAPRDPGVARRARERLRGSLSAHPRRYGHRGPARGP